MLRRRNGFGGDAAHRGESGSENRLQSEGNSTFRWRIRVHPRPNSPLLHYRDSVARSLRNASAGGLIMSTPLQSNNGAHGGDAGSVSAFLSLSSEAKARIRALVVDDEHPLCETCAVVLRAGGFDVTACSRGQEALDLLKHRPFDIVIVDLCMCGGEVLALVR